MSDLTELAALQKQIRWKENLAALGEMSAGIAHEFKNALATISGYAQMIHSEANPGDIRGFLRANTRPNTGADTRGHRISALREAARNLLRNCDYAAARRTRGRGIARDRSPECAVECEGEFVDLPGDEALLRQALVNLTRNAAEAARTAAESPHVKISGTMEELGGRHWQRICVADNGPGIPERDLPKIFLPFYTTKSEGTGLGLAVVQKVALQHGGSMEARNRPDSGRRLPSLVTFAAGASAIGVPLPGCAHLE